MRFLVLVIISVFTMASGDVDLAKVEGVSPIKAVITKYNQAAMVKMKLQKKVFLSVLEQTKSSSGSLSFSKGLLRMEIERPDFTLVVLNKTALWVQTEVEGFGEKPSLHVTKIVSKDLKNRSKAPLALLLTDVKAWDGFDVDKIESKGAVTTFWVSPKNKEQYPDLSKVRIAINSKENLLLSLTYKDDIENEVSYDFSGIVHEKKSDPSKFVYSPPEEADVVEY